MKLLYAVINSGFSTSGPVDARRINAIRAIHVPAMTSGDLFVQGALDSGSGSFSRLIETRAVGSADMRFATGAGSRFIAWPFGETLPPFLRLEAAVPQADNRTLTLLSR
jgi:hypothetical protein